ncbi:MAG: hypothetical protein O3A81_02595 [bacterium]|nr:hypothetical protein [bacterium]
MHSPDSVPSISPAAEQALQQLHQYTALPTVSGTALWQSLVDLRDQLSDDEMALLPKDAKILLNTVDSFEAGRIKKGVHQEIHKHSGSVAALFGLAS